MKQSLACWIVICWCATAALACWQTDAPRVSLATRPVNLRVTYNDKAQSGRTFVLHKAITLNPEPESREERYEKKALKSITTDSRGLASFGDIEPGIYWIVGGAEDIAITVVPPRKSEAKRVWVNEFADGCISAELERAD